MISTATAAINVVDLRVDIAIGNTKRISGLISRQDIYSVIREVNIVDNNIINPSIV